MAQEVVFKMSVIKESLLFLCGWELESATTTFIQKGFQEIWELQAAWKN